MYSEIFLITALLYTFVHEASLALETANKHANVGETLRLKCPDKEIISSTVQWRFQKTGELISADYNISKDLSADVQERYLIIDRDESQHTLKISNIKESDEDLYECGYIDKQGKFVILYSAKVNVRLLSTNEDTPVCSLEVSSPLGILTSDSLATFNCSVAVLQKGEQLVWLREDASLKQESQNTLILSKNISSEDIDKLFICQIYTKNSKKDIKTQCAIRTSKKPVVLSNERNYVDVGSDVNITCEIRSSSESPTWQFPNVDFLKRLSFSNKNRTIFVSNISIKDNNTVIVCSNNGYKQTATIIVLSGDTIGSTVVEYIPTQIKNSISVPTKEYISGVNSVSSSISGADMGFTSTSISINIFPTDKSFVDIAIASTNATSLTSTSSSPDSQSGFEEFLQMVHMSHWVFIAAAIGTFIFLVILLILFICCYKYVQSKKPARLAISDSFYSGLANVHKSTNYPLHYNAMHKRGFGRASAASSLFGEDDLEGSNLLEIIVQGKFPENDMQFSDTLEHCNPDDSCLSSAKDFGNLATGTRDYGTSADTLDGTDEGICSGSGETRFDFDFDSPINTKQSTIFQQAPEKEGDDNISIVKDTLC